MTTGETSKHRTFRIPVDIDDALTDKCKALGVTRTQYVIQLLRNTLATQAVLRGNTSATQGVVQGNTSVTQGVVQGNTLVTQEDFDLLEQRVAALEANTKPARKKKASQPRPARATETYEYNGKVATLREHLNPILEALGKKEVDNAMKNIHRQRKKGKPDAEAIENELRRRLGDTPL